MFGRKRGTWVRFDLVNPNAKIASFGTSCISTSAEAAGHLQSVVGSGRIAGINDRVIERPQIPQAAPEPVQA
jgi:hypothetical protein